MMDYLKKPGDYSWEEKHYYSEDLPRNGYIKCDMGGQFDYLTEMCYWRRPNEHQLVGVLMQIGHEGEACDALILFYDFDPKTQVMSPDTTIHQTVMKIVNNHTGSHGLTFLRITQRRKRHRCNGSAMDNGRRFRL